MRMKFMTLVLALSAAMCFQSCSDDDDNKVGVPAELQQAFEQKYPAAKNVNWATRAGHYVASFTNEQQQPSAAWFSETTGAWQMTEVDVPQEALPAAVKATFDATEYAKEPWVFDEAELLERTGYGKVYVIEVEQGKEEMELFITPEGKLVKCVADKDGDQDGDNLPLAALTDGMKQFIAEKYASFTIVEADIEDDPKSPYVGCVEVDIVKGLEEQEVLFDKQGNWVLTSSEMLYEKVPAVVTEAFAKEYPSFVQENKNVEKVEKADGSVYYEFEIEVNDLDQSVKYTPEGVKLEK